MTFISRFKSLFLRQKPQNVKFCGFFVLSGVFTEHQQTNNQSIKEKNVQKTTARQQQNPRNERPGIFINIFRTLQE